MDALIRGIASQEGSGRPPATTRVTCKIFINPMRNFWRRGYVPQTLNLRFILWCAGESMNYKCFKLFTKVRTPNRLITLIQKISLASGDFVLRPIYRLQYGFGVRLAIKITRVRLPVGARLCSHSGQVVNTLMPVSPCSVIWYRSIWRCRSAVGKVTVGLALH